MYERPTGGPEEPASRIDGFPPGFDPFAPQGSYFVPNSFTLWERTAHTLLALALLAYGVIGLMVDDLFVPGRGGRGIHLHGAPAWIMFGAIVCASAVLLALVADHYDRRNNEQRYVRFKRRTIVAAWCFFAGALLWHLSQSFGFLPK